MSRHNQSLNWSFKVGRMERISREIQNHDYKLFCAKNREGTPCVFRKGQSLESYTLEDGLTVLSFVRPTPYLVFALTDTWRENGRPVDWGLEPIMKRLKDIDLWNRDIVKTLEEQEEKEEAAKERAMKNSNEDFLYEFHSSFKKTFKDTNVSNLSKKSKKRGSKWES